MAGVKDTIKENPLILVLVLVGLGIVSFLIYGLFAGAAVTVSGILLTIIVLFGLGLVLFLLKGAGAGRLEAEDFILLVMAGGAIFGLTFLVTKFSPGAFAIYDAPLNEIQSIVGSTTNLWIIVGILALIFLFGTRRGKIAQKKLGL